MPTVTQITVEATSISSPRAKGDRNEANLRSIYSASPIFKNDITNASIREFYQEEVLDAKEIAGNGFANVSLNYEDAPNFDNVDIATHRIPSPYMPNPTSPGPGSIDPAQKPLYTGNVPDPEFIVEFGSGLGGLVSPSETAAQISEQGMVSKLGNYISGKSYPGSDGTP